MQQLTIESQTGQLSALQFELNSLKSQLQAAQTLCSERENKISSLLITIDEKKAAIATLESEVREGENLRKKLHNTIQELKGNIRVFCRIRPLRSSEQEENGGQMPFEVAAHTGDKQLDVVTSVPTAVPGKVEKKTQSFSYDKVFSPHVTQQRVFEEISQLVQSVLDGYNCCIFAYGQTGSGKTYTMEGPGLDADLPMPELNELRGMIPRAVEQIFASAQTLREKGWEYEMEASYLEIYMEQIYDLLASSSNSNSNNCGKKEEEIKYEIKADAKGMMSVSNLTCVKVRSPHQVYDLLRRAGKNRSVGLTNMNHRSSRSHAVFQLKLVGTNTITSEAVNGILNLIDLAGSERIAQSGSTSGARLKETQFINKSLSHLGDVIAALAEKKPHIPYRNSSLTHLLQNSLGGNSKSLMFVNISPRLSDINETICSLRFAAKVNACEIGTAKKQAKVDFNN